MWDLVSHQGVACVPIGSEGDMGLEGEWLSGRSLYNVYIRLIQVMKLGMHLIEVAVDDEIETCCDADHMFVSDTGSGTLIEKHSILCGGV